MASNHEVELLYLLHEPLVLSLSSFQIPFSPRFDFSHLELLPLLRTESLLFQIRHFLLYNVCKHNG